MKKFLSSIAILATVLGMTSAVMAKSFSDVKNTKYENAVEILSELKIVNGVTDKEYMPNNSVKRSEMAKLIIIAMGKEDSADILKGNTLFSDVASNHWASGYINLASSLGLIKGYPDGTFKPDASVSYVEASTMLLRALSYGKELDSLSWPKGYMSKANSAGILDNVTADNSSEAVIRGNAANMLLNTLKANTRKVISSDSTGNKYGNGNILMENTFKDLTYVREGTVIDINVEDEILTIKDTENDRKVKVLYTDSSNLKKMFGREVSFIYDDDSEDFLEFNIIDSLSVAVINVKEIDTEYDVIVDEDGEEFDLPKSDNILFIGSTRYEDIKKAYLTRDSKKNIKYVTLEGPEKIYAGIITDSGFKVNSKNAIEVKDTAGEYKDIVLAYSSAKIYKNNVVLYTLNNSEQLIIKTQEEAEDAYKITDVTSSSITLKGKSKISFDSTSDYFVYLVNDKDIRTAKLSDIDKSFDKATILEYTEVYYIIVFEDSISPDDIETNVSVNDAKKALKSALDAAKKKKEADYSVVSFERLRDAIDIGNKIYTAASSYSSAKIQLATRDINNALSRLEKVTTADKELRTAFASLQSEIKKAEAIDKADYTEATYNKLATAITEAKKIVIEATTLSKVSTAKNNLTSAMNLLVTNASASQVVEALARLDKAIADAKLIKLDDYTQETYDDLQEKLKLATNVNRTTASAREINNVASNLEAAIDALMPRLLATYKDNIEKLDANLKLMNDKKEVEYTVASWAEFTNLKDGKDPKTGAEKYSTTIAEAYEAIKSYEDAEKLPNATVKTENEKVLALNKRITEALNVLVSATDARLRENSLKLIDKCIAKAAEYTEETWNSTISWTDLQKLITEAKAMKAKPEDYTTLQLKEMSDGLILYFTLD